MRRIAYPAAIIGPTTTHQAHSVLFPDVPGCFSVGSDIQDAFGNAIDALEAHLGLLLEDGEDLPTPSQLDHARSLVEADTGDGDGPIIAMVLVPAVVPGRSQRFNITMDENLVAQIDAVSSNRSAFLADAARRELRRRQSNPG